MTTTDKLDYSVGERVMGNQLDYSLSVQHSLSGKSADNRDQGASVCGTSANIIKNTVGAGILVLPTAFASGGLVVGSAILLTVCVSCAYSFYVLGQCCDRLSQDGEECYSWEDIMQRSLGPEYAGVSSWLVFILCSLAMLIYAIVAGTFVSGAVITVFPDLPRYADSPWQYVVMVSVFVMLPLSYFEKLDSLRFTSTAGVIIIFYGTMLVLARCIYTYTSSGTADLSQTYARNPGHLTEAFSLLPRKAYHGGKWYRGMWYDGMNIVGALNTMSAAANCHFNAPQFYRELKDRNLDTFYSATSYGFGAIGLFNFAMALGVYFAFGVLGKTGNAPSGTVKPILDHLVLGSFIHEQNVGISKGSTWEYLGLSAIILWAICIALGYPLVFLAARSTLFEICPCLKADEGDTTGAFYRRVAVTSIFVPIVCGMATVLVMSSGGSAVAYLCFGLLACSVGNLITYILPGLMWIKLNPKMSMRYIWPCYFIVGLGSIFSLVGIVENGSEWYQLLSGHTSAT